MRNTKIIATLGPATDPPGVLECLLEAGVDVVRLNASHGSQEDRMGRIQEVRAIAARRGLHTAILLDLQGPKIRLGKFEGGSAELKTGSEFTITVEPVTGNCERASTSYGNFARDVRPGDRILLADGAVELRVSITDGLAVRCEVVAGGLIGDHKGINLPGANVSAPSLSEKDRRDLEFGVSAGIDIVALSFVRTAADVSHLRQFLREGNAETPIVAKIEKPEAWENFEEILAESDGVMVARGDLGVEIDLAKVPAIQKAIIERTRRAGKFVITATQMLESMVNSPFPTRAEVSDVANAIYDGTDAIMLSAETSVGKFPAQAVRMMDRIAREAEHSAAMKGSYEQPHGSNPTRGEIVADAAFHAAKAAQVAAIVVFTASGSSARLVSRYRPRVPIYAFTPNALTARRLAANFGVRSVQAPDVASTDEMLLLMDRELLEKRWLARGDLVVFMAGQPIGRLGTTNLMKLHRVGEFDHAEKV